MYSEIDLRKYLRILFRNWKWILGSGILISGITLIVSFLLPPIYEATVLVVITKPYYMLQFDERFETIRDAVPVYKAYPELAVSRSLLSVLLNQLQAEPGNYSIATLSGLQAAVKARSGADPGLVYLDVRSRSPQEAQVIATLWAELLVKQAKSIYDPQGADQLAFIEMQLTTTRAEVDAAEKALVDFESRNLSNIVRGRLTAYQTSYVEYVNTLRSINDLKRDIQGLQVQLREASEVGALSLGDQLTLVLLQVKAFNVGQDTPFEIQLNNEQAIAVGDVEGYLVVLGSLSGVLDTKVSEIEAELQLLEPQILELQGQLRELESQADSLRMQRDVAKDAYLVLARKQAEVRIASENTAYNVKLVGAAVLNDGPVSPRKLLNTVVAWTLATLGSILIVLVVESWRAE